LTGFDRDTTALQRAAATLAPFIEAKRAELVHANFASLASAVGGSQQRGLADGILLDVGVSSIQLDDPTRGFSYRQNGPLDMRMDVSQDVTAEHIVNSADQQELEVILREYGEEPRWRRAAERILTARRQGRRITTTHDLVEVVAPNAGKGTAAPGRSRLHPAALVFQGLRIAVNLELHALHTAIPAAVKALAPGGRLAVISFHSLEDRIVKQAFKQRCKESGGEFTLLTKRPVTAKEEETRENPRSRSAKLRVLERSPGHTAAG